MKWLLLLTLLLAACAPVATPTPTLTPDEQDEYEYQTGMFSRMWYEITQEDRLAACRDYFADPEAVFEYVDENWEGELSRLAFDDFFGQACKLVPIPTLEMSG